MKWIKYQIVCGKNQNEEDILINKKVGYSAENIAIAENEAYNGYTIEEDTESFDKEPLAIELGGTHANNANDARKNLGAFAVADYDGLFAKTGNFVQANLKKGRGISAITTILPAQSGSGNPYPAGGGKNKLDVSEAMASGDFKHQGVSGTWRDDGDIILNGTLTGEAWIGIGFTMMVAGNTYTVSVGGNVRVSIWDRTANALVDDVYSGIPITFVAANTGAYAYAFASATGTTFSNERVMLMVNEGSEALPWEPSINVRPITGWTGTKLTRCGKNLLPDIRISSGGFTSDGNGVFKYVSNNNTTISTFTFKAGVSYTISATAVSGTGYKPCIIVRNPTGDRDGQKTNYGATGNPLTFSFDTDTNFNIILQAETGNGLTTANDSWAIQLELGSTATPYEPYQGNTYTADFGQTVYGGTLDWQTGVLTVDKAMVTLTGEDGAKMTGTSGVRPQVFGFDNSLGILKPADGSLVADALSSHFKITSWTELTSGSMFDAFAIHANGSIGFAYNGTISEANAWLSAQYAAGTPVQIVYKLATPTTIQLTPQEMIEALGGVNMIYTDCGSNDVTFNHDLTLLNAVPKPTPESIGAAPANHTHTPESIGAAKSNHTHADFAYSEAEVNTGKTWIDGKPIYKKTIAITSTISAPAGVTTKVVGAILDIDVPIKIYGAVAYHSDNAPHTWYQLGSHVDLEDKMWTGSTISAATGQVKLYVSNLTIGSGYITVEYTKKTN